MPPKGKARESESSSSGDPQPQAGNHDLFRALLEQDGRSEESVLLDQDVDYRAAQRNRLAAKQEEEVLNRVAQRVAVASTPRQHGGAQEQAAAGQAHQHGSRPTTREREGDDGVVGRLKRLLSPQRSPRPGEPVPGERQKRGTGDSLEGLPPARVVHGSARASEEGGAVQHHAPVVRSNTTGSARADSPSEMQLRAKLSGLVDKEKGLPEDRGQGAELGDAGQPKAPGTGAQLDGGKQERPVVPGLALDARLTPQQLAIATQLKSVPLMEPTPDAKAEAKAGGRGGGAAGAPHREETSASGSTLNHEGTYEYDEVEIRTFSLPRRIAVRLCGHPDFEMVVVLIIFANMLTLALYRPTEGESSKWNRGLFWAEAAFNIMFTVEMVLRMLALGGVFAYLRQPWNVFDSSMVAAGYVAFIPTDSSSSGVRALRALRALRPLRTVTRFESLRAIVVCFLEAVPLLSSAVGLMLLFMFVFAVAGTNLYANIYHQKCYSVVTGEPEESEQDPDMLGCGNWRSCPANYTCNITARTDAVSYAGYDNVGVSMLSVFQCITLTGWSFAFYRTTDNTNPIAAVYYLLLVAIGAYVLINLFLAVLKIKFAKAQTAFRARNAGRTRTRRNSVMTFFMGVKSKFSEYSAKRSQASMLNSSLANAISSKISQLSSAQSVAAPGLDAAAYAALQAAAGARVSGAGAGSRTGSGPPRSYHASPRISQQGAAQQEVQAQAVEQMVNGGDPPPLWTPPPRAQAAQGAGAVQQEVQVQAAEQVVNGGNPPPLWTPPPRAQAAQGAGAVQQEVQVQAAEHAPQDGEVPPLWTPPPRAQAARGAGPAVAGGGDAAGAGAVFGPVSASGGAAPSRATSSAAPGSEASLGVFLGAASVVSDRSSGGQRTSRAPGMGALDEEEPAAAGPDGSAMGPAAAQAAQPEQQGASGGGARGAGPVAEGTEPAEGGVQGVEDGRPSATEHLLSGVVRDAATGEVVVRGKTLERRAGALPPLDIPAPGPPGAAGGSPAAAAAAAGRSSRDDTAAQHQLGSASPMPSPRRDSDRAHEKDRGRHPNKNQVVPMPFSISPGSTAPVTPTAGAHSHSHTPHHHHHPQQPSPSAHGGAAGRHTTGNLSYNRGGMPGGGGSMVGGSMIGGNPEALMGGNMGMAAMMMDPAEFDDYVASEPPMRRFYLRTMFRARVLATSSLFNNIMLAVIIANTITLAMEYDGMSESYMQGLVNCNYAFTAIFTSEMIIKLYGMGIWDYIQDGFNLFDAVVVILSWLDIIMTQAGSGASLNAMAALRSFRVLRLLKMFRYLGPLRKIAAMLLTAFASFAAIAVLIGLFWMVFAIVGMHVFGGIPLEREPYPNYDTFLNSLVTTFNILTLENYQNNMFNTIRATNYGSAAFFVAWIVVGKYILLTLFLAVTLEAFEAKYDTSVGGSWTSRMRSAMGSAMGSVISGVRRSVGGSRGSWGGSRGGSRGGSWGGSRRSSNAGSDAAASSRGPSTNGQWESPGPSTHGPGPNGAAHAHGQHGQHGPVQGGKPAEQQQAYGRGGSGDEDAGRAAAAAAAAAAAVPFASRGTAAGSGLNSPYDSASSTHGPMEERSASGGRAPQQGSKLSRAASPAGAQPAGPMAEAIEPAGGTKRADPAAASAYLTPPRPAPPPGSKAAGDARKSSGPGAAAGADPKLRAAQAGAGGAAPPPPAAPKPPAGPSRKAGADPYTRYNSSVVKSPRNPAKDAAVSAPAPAAAGPPRGAAGPAAADAGAAGAAGPDVSGDSDLMPSPRGDPSAPHLPHPPALPDPTAAPAARAGRQVVAQLSIRTPTRELDEIEGLMRGPPVRPSTIAQAELMASFRANLSSGAGSRHGREQEAGDRGGLPSGDLPSGSLRGSNGSGNSRARLSEASAAQSSGRRSVDLGFLQAGSGRTTPDAGWSFARGGGEGAYAGLSALGPGLGAASGRRRSMEAEVGQQLLLGPGSRRQSSITYGRNGSLVRPGSVSPALAQHREQAAAAAAVALAALSSRPPALPEEAACEEAEQQLHGDVRGAPALQHGLSSGEGALSTSSRSPRSPRAGPDAAGDATSPRSPRQRAAAAGAGDGAGGAGPGGAGGAGTARSEEEGREEATDAAHGSRGGSSRRRGSSRGRGDSTGQSGYSSTTDYDGGGLLDDADPLLVAFAEADARRMLGTASPAAQHALRSPDPAAPPSGSCSVDAAASPPPSGATAAAAAAPSPAPTSLGALRAGAMSMLRNVPGLRDLLPERADSGQLGLGPRSASGSRQGSRQGSFRAASPDPSVHRLPAAKSMPRNGSVRASGPSPSPTTPGKVSLGLPASPSGRLGGGAAGAGAGPAVHAHARAPSPLSGFAGMSTHHSAPQELTGAPSPTGGRVQAQDPSRPAAASAGQAGELDSDVGSTPRTAGARGALRSSMDGDATNPGQAKRRMRVSMVLPPEMAVEGAAPGERPTAQQLEHQPLSVGLLSERDSLDDDSVGTLSRRSTALSSAAGSALDANDTDRELSGAPRVTDNGANGEDGEEGEGEGKKKKKKKNHNPNKLPFEGKSFFYFGTDNKLRKKAYKMVNGRPFEYTLFAIIVFNCIVMAIECPAVRPESPLGLFLHYSNAVCTGIFTVEMLVKVFAWGFVLYIKQVTNQVDFVVVATGLLELTLTAFDLSAVAALRVLRALKPLRLLTRSAGMRLVFKSVVLSLGAMAHVSVLCVMFLLIFAILGVQLFSGRLYSCNDPTVSGVDTCVGTYVDPASNQTLERAWENPWPNFDNVGNALMACFVVASLNGYAELMYATMSAPALKGEQPHTNANPGAFFWFVGFAVVVSFTLLNLYVGVIFSQFSKIRNMSTTGSAFLTNKQQEWVEMSKMVFKLKPPERNALPRGRNRLRVWRLVQSPAFEKAMMVVIVLNVAMLAATWYDEPEMSGIVQGYLNIAFTCIYVAEAALKIYGLGRRVYFKDGWNRFDFLLVLAGVLDAALSFLHTGFMRILRIFRLQRLLRVMRLIRKSKGIKTLFQSLVMSLPAFGNVGALLGLFFFMYAYVGVMLFGRVRQDDDMGINSSANFSNFLYALSALLRVATGDNWTDIMYGCWLKPPDCDPELKDCGSWLALPYFLTFFLVTPIIMLNLFTAVIIENFEKTHEQDAWRLTPQNLEDFVTLWSEYDDGSGTIDPRALEELLLRLDPPLGLGPYADNKEVLRFVYDLDIPLVAGRVPFHKTAFELVKRTSQADIPDGQLKVQLEALIQAFFRDLQQPDEQMQFNIAISVMLIQRRWRTRMRAARLRHKKVWRADRRQAPGYTQLMLCKTAVGEAWRTEEETRASKAALAAARRAAEAKARAEAAGLMGVVAPVTPRPAEGGRPGTYAALLAAQNELRWAFNPALTPTALHPALVPHALGTAPRAAVRPTTAKAREAARLPMRFFRMMTMGLGSNDPKHDADANPRRGTRDAGEDGAQPGRVSASGGSRTSAASGGAVHAVGYSETGTAASAAKRSGLVAGFRRLFTSHSGTQRGREEGAYSPALEDLAEEGEGEEEDDREEGRGHRARKRAASLRRAITRGEDNMRAPAVARQSTAASVSSGGGLSRGATRAGLAHATSRSDAGLLLAEPHAAVRRGSSSAAAPPARSRPKSAAARVFASSGAGGANPSRATSLAANADPAAARKFKAMLNFALAASELTAAAASRAEGAHSSEGRRRSSGARRPSGDAAHAPPQQRGSATGLAAAGAEGRARRGSRGLRESSSSSSSSSSSGSESAGPSGETRQVVKSGSNRARGA